LNPHVFILQKYAEAETYQKSQKEKRKGKIKENMIRTIDTTSPRKGTPHQYTSRCQPCLEVSYSQTKEESIKMEIIQLN
jgi:hypothetical protein